MSLVQKPEMIATRFYSAVTVAPEGSEPLKRPHVDKTIDAPGARRRSILIRLAGIDGPPGPHGTLDSTFKST